MNLFKSIIAIVVIIFAVGCTKETVTEKTIVPERQANEKLNDSMSVDKSNQITLTKQSLGKAFILIPTAISTGQHPDVNYLKPLIISFEKSGNQVALFNLTEEQLYDTIPSDRLLQTFEVIAETETSIIINLSKGFTSFNAKDNMGVLLADIYKDMTQSVLSGIETSIEVKDSFVRSAETSENSIFIEQAMRIKNNSLKEKTSPFDPEKKVKLNFESTETTIIYVLEIKPYHLNTKFQPKIYDKEQRIGYFLNFAVQKSVDEPVPQIMRWDIDPAKGPIVVRIHKDTPIAAYKSIEEGVLYWNRVIGQEILTIGEPFASNDRQIDRTIHVFWIPWDSAGFARAGFQADPVTGEIFRGQVFMTSSWYKSTKEDFEVILNSNNDQKSTPVSACQIDQSKIFDIEILNLTKPEMVEKVTTDTIRIVLAHELGHALGLRHNFSGSATTAIPDSDFKNYTKNYLNDEKSIPTSTTVMDYTGGIDTAMNGAYILDHVLPYDKAAIEWGYLNTEISIDKYKYCSDEHIMLANTNNKNIYGCDRFDKYKNIILGNLNTILASEERKVTLQFMNTINSIKSGNSNYSAAQKFETTLSLINFNSISVSDSLENLIYKEPSTSFYNVQTVIDSLLPSLKGSDLTKTDSTINDIIKKDAIEIGGFSEMIEQLLGIQNKADGKMYEKQTLNFFEKLEPSVYQNIINQSQFEQIKNKMLEEAKKSDSTYLTNILKTFPIIKTMYEKDPTTKEYKPVEHKISIFFSIGKIDQLFGRYMQAYESVIHKNAVQGSILGITKEYKFTDPYDANLDLLKKIFSKKLLPDTIALSSEKEIQNGIEKMKLISVANTIDLLKNLGLENQILPVTSTKLTGLLDLVDFTKITGFIKYNFQREIEELKKIEELK